MFNRPPTCLDDVAPRIFFSLPLTFEFFSCMWRSVGPQQFRAFKNPDRNSHRYAQTAAISAPSTQWSSTAVCPSSANWRPIKNTAVISTSAESPARSGHPVLARPRAAFKPPSEPRENKRNIPAAIISAHRSSESVEFHAGKQDAFARVGGGAPLNTLIGVSSGYTSPSVNAVVDRHAPLLVNSQWQQWYRRRYQADVDNTGRVDRARCQARSFLRRNRAVRAPL